MKGPYKTSITGWEMRKRTRRLEAPAKRPRVANASNLYACAAHDRVNFKREYSHRSYVSGYNSVKG